MWAPLYRPGFCPRGTKTAPASGRLWTNPGLHTIAMICGRVLLSRRPKPRLYQLLRKNQRFFGHAAERTPVWVLQRTQFQFIGEIVSAPHQPQTDGSPGLGSTDDEPTDPYNEWPHSGH